MISRRDFNLGAGALTLAAGLGVGLALPREALAQTVSAAELMQPGPLPDLAVGAADAPVTVIEYASMTCPHCASFHENTWPELKKRYIDPGKVRFIFREFPLDILAAAGFMLARCAAAESTGQAASDKYHGIVELLFQTQTRWAVEKPLVPLFNVVKQAGFTQQTFDACLANQKMLQDVQAMRDRAAQKFGVQSTPTFFINGKRMPGALTIMDLEKEIQPLIKS